MIFIKTAGHSDCPLTPLDTNAFVTAWIPLRPIVKVKIGLVSCTQAPANEAAAGAPILVLDMHVLNPERGVVVQGHRDSGLEFAQGSHRDVAVHFHNKSRGGDLRDRGYKIASVGAPRNAMPPLFEHSMPQYVQQILVCLYESAVR